MKRNYISPKRRNQLKADRTLVPITNFFKTPPKNESAANSAKSTPNSKIKSEESPLRQLKQLSLTEMRSNSNTATPKHCKRKLELVPVLEKLPDLVVKNTLRNTSSFDTSNMIQNKDKNESKNVESDDELPECLNNDPIISSQESDYSPTKPAMTKFVPRKYKFNINNILEEREQKKESNLLIKKMEEELREGKIELDGHSNELEESGFSVKNLDYCIKNDIKREPPGIDLFDLSKCYCLYTIPISPKRPDNANSVKQEFDKMFESLEPTSLFRVLRLCRLSTFPEKLYERPWLLSYIFHIMSSNQDEQLVHSCFEILASVQKICKQEQKALRWKPTLVDFIAVLANHGADLDKIASKNRHVEYSLDALKENYLNEPSRDPADIQQAFVNLPLVFQAMSLFVQVPDAYNDEEKALMLYSSIATSLDKQINNVFLIDQIRYLVDAIISSFSEQFWCTKITEVVESLLFISSHHHNQVYIVQEMPYTERGYQLQKLFSFTALKYLLGIKFKEQILNVNIPHILAICNRQTLTGLNDYYKLHSALELINSIITPELENGAMTQETLEQLKSVLRETNGKLIDRIYNWDITMVKNLLTHMMARLSLLKDTLPSNQKTLFQYVALAPKHEVIPCTQDDVNEDLEDKPDVDLLEVRYNE